MKQKLLILLSPLLIFLGINSPLIKQPPPKPPADSSTFRLSTPLMYPDIIPIFNQYADPQDSVEVKPKNIDQLSLVQTENKVLIFNQHQDPEQMIKLALQHQIPYIGYNLEDVKLSKDQLINQQKQIFELAKQNNLKYIFVPLARHMIEYGPDLAPHADALLLQLRNLQLTPDFQETVNQALLAIKKANPNLEIWAQIDTAPHQPKTSPKDPTTKVPQTSQALIEQINQIKDNLDVLTFWYGPDKLNIIKDIFIHFQN